MPFAIHLSRFAQPALAALLLAALALPAAAQAPAGAGEAADAPPEQIEEIIVTARKIEENLQETPVAVSVFGEQAIRDLGLDSVDDVARFAPGLSFSRAFGRSTERPVIRGQSNILAGVQSGVESGAAYFVDGIYYQGDIQSLDMNEIARVEVIKGPQSALYGRNTYAGALNFVTRAPGDRWRGHAKARAAEHGTLEFSGGVSGPLFANLFGSLQLRSWEYDGEWTNTLTGKKVGSEETQQFAASLDWRPGENFRARTRYAVSEDDDGTLAIFLQDASANNCYPGYNSLRYRYDSQITDRGPRVTGPVLGPDGRPSMNGNQYFCGVVKPGPVALNTDAYEATRTTTTIVIDPNTGMPVFDPVTRQPMTTTTTATSTIPDGTAFDGIERTRQWGSLVLDWDIAGSGWEAALLANYHTKRENFGFDGDYSAVNDLAMSATETMPATEAVFAASIRDIARDWSAELRLASPADRRIRYLAGAYIYRHKEETRDISFESGTPGAYEGEQSETDSISNAAAFALLSLDLLPMLTLTAEGRYAKERKYHWSPAVERLPSTRETPMCEGRPRPDLDRCAFYGVTRFSDFTPRFTLDYQLGEEMLLYAIFTRGVKPGGLNGEDGRSVGAVTFQKEESDNIEIGVKSAWLNERLTASTAFFLTDAENVQLTTPVPGQTSSVVTNKGQAEITGAELEFALRATRNLNFGLSYAWADSEFTEGCDAFQYTLTSGGYIYYDVDPDGDGPLTAGPQGPADAGGSCSIAGNQLPLTSEHMASAWAKWERPIIGNLEFFAGANLSYESSKFAQVHNGAETGDALLLGARMGLRGSGGRWELAFAGYNLTDEDSVTAVTRWFQAGNSCGTPEVRFRPGPPPTPETVIPATGNYGSNPAIPNTVDLRTVRGCGNSGSPRTVFGSLRRGRSLGVELSVRF